MGDSADLTPLWVTPTMTKSGMTAELSGSLTDVHREGLVPEGIKGTQLLVSSGLLVQRSVASLGCIHHLTDLLSQLTDAASLPLLLTDKPQQGTFTVKHSCPQPSKGLSSLKKDRHPDTCYDVINSDISQT